MSQSVLFMSPLSSVYVNVSCIQYLSMVCVTLTVSRAYVTVSRVYVTVSVSRIYVTVSRVYATVSRVYEFVPLSVWNMVYATVRDSFLTTMLQSMDFL